MSGSNGGVPDLEFHPKLVEATVLRAVRSRPEAAEFHHRRDPLYAEPDRDRRERLFGALHLDWFRRLGLDRPFRDALAELGAALATARRVLAGPAAHHKDEGAELFVNDAGERSVVLTIAPETIAPETAAHGAAALLFLRREFLHVADMLDQSFAYEPRLPRQEAGPSHDRRLQDRYRALWNCTVDGRLARAGHAGAPARAARRREFLALFACLGEAAGDCFAALFDGERPAHPALVAMASDPAKAFGLADPGPAAGGRCALCSFATAEFEPDADGLPAAARDLLAAEFPAWAPAAPICRQCADLYRARAEDEGRLAL
jgi:hypothetical protein